MGNPVMDYAGAIKSYAYNIAHGENIVAFEFIHQNQANLTYGHLPNSYRNSWSGFVLDLAMGISVLSDLYPGIRVASSHFKNNKGFFSLAQGDFRRNYYCILTAISGIVSPAADTLDTDEGSCYWGYDYPRGFMDEIRGNFLEGKPYGKDVHLL
ncbi:hypothetical protein [Kocuria sp. PD6]|uniref:hypothetical protein n=1 Tax=Kocuria sp. PD6 TaxID=2962590 RepID=UPI0028819EEE|nr:hypothetical protein [Kocuria sp. PD6]MDT0120664.1 hypothetical protein [Kocuria sp. PD6]